MTGREAGVADDAAIRSAIEALLDGRRAGASICPSDVARHLHATRWRPLMPVVRDVAWALEAQGSVVITQGGTRVDRTAKGPIRIRRP